VRKGVRHLHLTLDKTRVCIALYFVTEKLYRDRGNIMSHNFKRHKISFFCHVKNLVKYDKAARDESQSRVTSPKMAYLEIQWNFRFVNQREHWGEF